VVAVLFLGGAAYLLISSVRHSDDHGEADAARLGAVQPSFARIFATTFGIIFLAEWGDITQITVANFAARYADPVAVAVGAALGLAAVSALAVNVGAKSLKALPMVWIQRVTGTILIGFGVYSAIQAITG
jgi:putative Ca2+/H+ antiporter (TMEM165/GDT1 family)